jgi:hypothetical protein
MRAISNNQQCMRELTADEVEQVTGGFVSLVRLERIARLDAFLDRTFRRPGLDAFLDMRFGV